MSSETGPIYGVELIETLPLGGGMKQAMPSRADLEQAAKKTTRVSAGYEVLLEHYRAAIAENERMKDAIREVIDGGSWSPTGLQEVIGEHQ